MFIPFGFAANEMGADNSIDDVQLDMDLNTSIQARNLNKLNSDYYFNSSSDYDGNGSIDSPYNELTLKRITDGSTIHLANGEYFLSNGKNLINVTIVGQDSEKTIINYDENANGIFKIKDNNYVILKNITIVGFNFELDGGVLEASNTTFKNSEAPYEVSSVSGIVNSALNSRGGAIHSFFNENYRSSIILNRCNFINNTAEYGGAIFIEGGILQIFDSLFLDNYAYNYGGSLVALYDCELIINKSRFINSKSLNGAGGACYLLESIMHCDDVTIDNSSATFGGAVASLNSLIEINNLNAKNNSAKYDGGAIYQMYNDISITGSNFINNSARNGGALFVDDIGTFKLINNNFENNSAEFIANSVYSFFVNFTINEHNNFSRNYSDDFYECSELNLNIGTGNYTIYYNNYTFDGNLPSRYSLLDDNYVTSIKDQKEGGNCWVFSAIAALESAILKASGDNLDLSEGNMKNLIALFSDYGKATETNDGGLNEMALAYLTSWLGPVYECLDEYDDNNMLSPILNSITHVQNVIYLQRSDFNDNDAIKEAIMKYGAVSSYIYFDDDYYSETRNSYCYPDYMYTNHVISIVGWDDNYSRNNFLSKPSGNGAWIVKNSWNVDWGDEGYFYVSYYDYNCAQIGAYDDVYVFVFNDTERYDKNYQYDFIGVTDYFSSNKNSLWVENIFDATDNELLAAVSTYFRKTTDYELFIYVNDELRLSKNGTAVPGYITINLGQYVPVMKGDKFKVVFKFTGKNTEFAISEGNLANKLTFSSNMSFFSYDGVDWFDLYDYNSFDKMGNYHFQPQVAAIKSFTILNEPQPILKLNISNNYNTVNVSVSIDDDKYDIRYMGNVSISVNGEEYCAELKNSKANKIFVFDDVGYYNFTVSYKNLTENYEVTIDKLDLHLSSSIDVGKDNISILLESSLTANSTVNIFVFNMDYPIDDRNYSIDLIDGKCNFKLNELNQGNYIVHVSVFDKEYVGDLDLEFNISVSKTIIHTIDYVFYYNSDTTCSINLTDIHGNPLSDCPVLFIAGEKSFNSITNENGVASVSIKLEEFSNQIISVLFYGKDDYLMSNNTFKINYKSTIEFLRSNYLADSPSNITFFDVDGSPLSKSDVEVVIDGMHYIIKTDVNGKISLNFNLKNGNHNIEVINYKTGEIKSQKVIIVSRIMENKNMDIYYLSGSYYKIRLYGDDGIHVGSNEIVKILLNKKTYYVKTNSNGYASLKISLKPNTYILTANYKGFKVSNKIIVKPLLTAKNISKKKSKIIKFSAKLVNVNGKVVKGKKITFKIKGKKYVVKTNKKGIATVNLKNLRVGKYIVNTICGKSNIKNKIIIKK